MIVDILSRAQYHHAINLQYIRSNALPREDILDFQEVLYEKNMQEIGCYLSTMQKRENGAIRSSNKFGKKHTIFFLQDGYLWKWP